MLNGSPAYNLQIGTYLRHSCGSKIPAPWNAAI